jgi:predicted nucleic acid-binding protein
MHYAGQSSKENSMPKQSVPVRVYADTSVFGGVFDQEFSRATRAFFGDVRARRLILVTSALVEEELTKAPPEVREHFGRMLGWMERAELTAEAIALRGAYLSAGIVTRKSATDALHVALATVSRCDVLVS